MKLLHYIQLNETEAKQGPEWFGKGCTEWWPRTHCTHRRVERAWQTDWQTDGQTPRSSVTIVCNSCIWCRNLNCNWKKINNWTKTELKLKPETEIIVAGCRRGQLRTQIAASRAPTSTLRPTVPEQWARRTSVRWAVIDCKRETLLDSLLECLRRRSAVPTLRQLPTFVLASQPTTTTWAATLFSVSQVQ